MTRRTRIELVLVALAVLVSVALAGCAKQAPQPTSLAPEAVSQVSSVRGTIPGLELVDVSTLASEAARPIGYWVDGGSKPDNQPTLKKGTYKPLISADHIAEASVTVAEIDGINQPALLLTFDPVGTQAFANYAASNEGKPMAVLLNSKVEGVLTVEAPTVPGQLQLNLGTEQMDAVKAAIVPAK